MHIKDILWIKEIKKNIKILLLSKVKKGYFYFCIPQSWNTNWIIQIQNDLKCKKVIFFHGMHEFENWIINTDIIM